MFVAFLLPIRAQIAANSAANLFVEGGPFSDYQRIFQGLALGLEERGLIENGHVPLPKDSEEARGMWEWLHQHAGGKRLVFPADGFYSAD